MKERIQELRNIINEADKSYYVDHISIMTDRKYDALLKELMVLEKKHPEFHDPNSPTSRVGSDLDSEFEKFEHKKPMLSISNSYSVSDSVAFIKKIKKDYPDASFTIEPKIDGLSLSLHYSNGELVRAVTRGNGMIGDDVTLNARTIKDIPLKISNHADIEIRGEAYMDFKTFEKINKSQEDLGLQKYANPRNLASGSLKQKRSHITASRDLKFKAYYIENNSWKDHVYSLQLSYIRYLGFKTPELLLVSPEINDIKQVLNEALEFKNHLEYPIDGLVIKINQLDIREKLGSVGKFPKSMIAYKMETEKAITVVKSISYQIGRTLVITPVANFEPVELAGTVVKRATMHNFKYIKDNGIRIGSIVEIEKAGEIIPQITKVIENPIGTVPIEEPTKCPFCSGPVSHISGYVAIKCTNSECFSSLDRKFNHFVASMDIKEIGFSSIATIRNILDLKNPVEIYDIKFEDLLELPGFGRKKARTTIDEINKSKNVETKKIITAFGINGVGSTIAGIIADKFSNIIEFSEYAASGKAIDGIGPVTMNNIKEWLNSIYGYEMISGLISYDIIGKASKKTEFTGTGFFMEKTFCLTGTLSTMTRKEASTEIEKRGGKISGLTRDTDYLIVGEKAGSKLGKAKNLGVSILTDEEFLRKLEENPC